MSEQVMVELRLIEQTFRLATTSDKKDELERAAQLLNEKFNDMRRSAPRVEHNKLVIMVALQLTQEVLSLNKSLQEYTHCERLLQAIFRRCGTGYLTSFDYHKMPCSINHRCKAFFLFDYQLQLNIVLSTFNVQSFIKRKLSLQFHRLK